MKLQRATTFSLLSLLTVSTLVTSNAFPSRACTRIEPHHISVNNVTPCKMHQICTFGCNETTDAPAKVMPHAARFCARSGDKKVLAHDFIGAIDDYTRATELNPTFARIFAPETDNFLIQCDLQALLADYDRVLLTNPDNPYALALRGEIKLNLRDKAGAEADFKKSLLYKRDLYFANLRLTESSLFLESDNITENISSAEFDKALQLFPHNARMHHNMGLALGQLGFAEMAAAEYSEANRLSPEWSRPYYMMAFADLERGDKQAAMTDLNKCIKYEPDWAWAYVVRAQQESKAHNYQAAIEDLDQAMELEPGISWLESCHARLRISSGDTLGGVSELIGIASRRSELFILLAMWFILGQLKLVSLGREEIRRRLLINE